MSVRTCLAAVAVLLVAAEFRPAAAQPVVPTRPRANAFQNLFSPGSSVVPNTGNVMPQGGVNNFGGPLAGPQGLISPYGILPFGPDGFRMSGQPVVFNNLGHWYSGSYGHWYPNGVQSGIGVLGNTGFSAVAGYGQSRGYGSGFRPGGAGGMGNLGIPQPVPLVGGIGGLRR